MSNIAVNTFAMKAVVIGTGSLEEFQQLGVAAQAYQPWARPTAQKRSGWPMTGEIHERAADARSDRATDSRRPGVASSAVPALD